jgi:hypothetical protein
MGGVEAMVNNLSALLRLAQGRDEQPSAVIFDSRTLQSTPERGPHAGYDGANRRKGSKLNAMLCGGLLGLVTGISLVNPSDLNVLVRDCLNLLG